MLSVMVSVWWAWSGLGFGEERAGPSGMALDAPMKKTCTFQEGTPTPSPLRPRRSSSKICRKCKYMVCNLCLSQEAFVQKHTKCELMG